MAQFTVEIASEEATESFGRRLADKLRENTVVSLVGTLGAGKTRLVQAVATALGSPRETITSPTFVLVNEYLRGRLPVYHFDAYRLKDDDEFLQLGPEEYFTGDGRPAGVTFVEWGDRVADCLPPERVEIAIEVLSGEGRRITLDDPAGVLGEIAALG